MAAIAGYGTYVPVYRIERATIADQHGDYAGDGETAVPAHDENVQTLAVNAAEHALDHAGEPPLDAVFVATTSDRFAERGLAAHVAYAVDAPSDVRIADFQGSARAGTNALLAARDVVETGGTALVVGTDSIPVDRGTSAERTSGAGAGAVVLDEGGSVANVDDHASNTTGFVGRFRPDASGTTVGDDRFNRHVYVRTVSETIDRLEATEYDHAVLPAPDDGWGPRALSEASLETDHRTTYPDVGYAGAAATFLDLGLALERAEPSERLLLGSYGPGGSDAVSLTAGEGVSKLPSTPTTTYLESKEYVTYAKHLDYRDWAGGDA